jgi:nucleoside-diphosphate-sugar epimerase
MKRVLVIGGAGYVGSVVAARLARRAHVTVLDPFWFLSPADWGVRFARFGAEEGVSQHIDLSVVVGHSSEAISDDAPADLSVVDVVVFCGGLSNDPMADFDPEVNWRENAQEPVRVAQVFAKRARRRRARVRFVFASSASVYDVAHKPVGMRPKHRAVGDIATEELEIDPRPGYSAAKAEAERRLLAMEDEYFVPIILRKGTVFGLSPRMRFDLVLNRFVRDAVAKGEMRVLGTNAWRPMLSIRDAASAYEFAAFTRAPKRRVYNVATCNIDVVRLANLTVEELVDVGVAVQWRNFYRGGNERSYRMRKTMQIPRRARLRSAVRELASELREWSVEELLHPRWENLVWWKELRRWGVVK